jgi:hypothetical protein
MIQMEQFASHTKQEKDGATAAEKLAELEAAHEALQAVHNDLQAAHK